MRKSIENEKQEIKPKTLVSVLLIFLVTAGLNLATQPGSYIQADYPAAVSGSNTKYRNNNTAREVCSPFPGRENSGGGTDNSRLSSFRCSPGGCK
ncbi:MAG: hypothetical protein ACOX6X_02925 [Dethiobacteria bacterium]|jgi:hypothetical protein